MTATDVEVVLVAPAQFKGDMSSAMGRVGTPMPRVAQPESWMPGPRVVRVESWASRGARPKSWVPRGAQSKSANQATKVLCRAWRSDHQGVVVGPLASIPGGWSDCLGWRSDH
jgi:hypothetical protein